MGEAEGWVGWSGGQQEIRKVSKCRRNDAVLTVIQPFGSQSS